MSKERSVRKRKRRKMRGKRKNENVCVCERESCMWDWVLYSVRETERKVMEV